MADDVCVYAAAREVDVIVFSEVHMAAAEPVDLSELGYGLVWAPRPCLATRAPAGGVAAALRLGGGRVEEVTVEELYDRADVTWFRLRLGDGREMSLAAVYLPPEGVEHCCLGCGNQQCAKAHVRDALSYLEESTARLAAKGDVVLAGDFNARAGVIPVSRRWREVQQSLLDEDLCSLVNPVGEDGALLPTRRDPASGTESVLDLVLVGVANSSGGTVTMSADSSISDHYPLLLTLTVPAAAEGVTEFPPGYGLHSPVPLQWRNKPKVALSRSADQLETYRGLVDDRLRAMGDGVGDVESEVSVLEEVLLQSAYEAGLCEKKATVDGAARAIILHQRGLESVRARLRELEAQRTAGGRPDEDLERLREDIRRLQQRQTADLEVRRALQRQRRQQARATEMATIQRLWVDNEAGLLGKQFTADAAGTGSRRSQRSLVPQRVRQGELWRRQRFLEGKYGGVAQALGAFTDVVADVVEPSYLEVEAAVKQLNGDSAAIGVPLFPLRWAASPLLLDRLRVLMGAIWRSGVVPASFCAVEVVLLPKPGSTDYRVIGVGSALSRLFRLIVYNRVLATVRPLLSPVQFGFLPGRSTEHASFLSASGTRCATAAGNTVETVFLDIAGAYASTSWALVVQRFREAGVSADLLRLTYSYYSQQRMFVKVGRLASDWVMVTVGLTEGDPMSPLTFILVIDNAVWRLYSAVLRDGARIGFRMADGTQLNSVWYADDGRLFALTAAGMVVLLDLASELFTALQFRFNRAPTKSAHQRSLPCGRGRQQALREAAGVAPFQLQGGAVPTVQEYKHVGLMTHGGGVGAALSAQTRKVRVSCATVIRLALTAPLSRRSLLVAISLYRGHWLPKVMYGAGLYATAPLQVMVDMESIVLRATMKGANTPLVALRSVAGLPTLQTRLDLDRLRVLLRFLRAPPRDLVRQQLYTEFQLYVQLTQQGTVESQRRRKTLWWHRTWELMRWLDVVCDVAVRGRIPLCPPSWCEWVEGKVTRWDEDIALHPDTEAVVKEVMLEVEHRRRRWELDRSAASLGEVRELLDTPNMAPFVVDVRRDLTLLRLQLRGGRRVLFGYNYFHLDQCPWCTAPGVFSVPHLLRDCPNWEQARVQCWEAARTVAREEGVAVTGGDVQQHRDNWYQLTCGAAVPHAFIGLHLDDPTHFARGERPATRHLRKNVAAYQRLLAVTGVLLREVVVRTRELLSAGNPMWGFTPREERRRVVVRHQAREEATLAQLAAGGGQPAADEHGGGSDGGASEGDDDAGAAAGGAGPADGEELGGGAEEEQLARLAQAVREGNRPLVAQLVQAAARAWGVGNGVLDGDADAGEDADLDVEAIVTALCEDGELHGTE